MPPDQHEPAIGSSRPSPMDGDRPRSRSMTPSENCSPLRRAISLPPRPDSRPSSEHDLETVSLGTPDEDLMDELPDPDEDTIRIPVTAFGGAAGAPTAAD